MKFLHLDSAESVFFARELEHVKTATYDVVYPELTATRLIPVSFEAGPAAESITYDQYDSVGIAQIIANYSQDLPRADVKAREFTSTIKPLGSSYGYNVQEIRASSKTGKNLPQRKANASRRAIEEKINKIAYFAKPDDGVTGGLCGLLYNPNVNKVAVTNGNWLTTASAKQMYDDLHQIAILSMVVSKGIEVPNTLTLPFEHYAKVSSTIMADVNNTTVLEMFLKAHPYIKTVEYVSEFAGVNPNPVTGAATASNVAVCYNRSPDKLTLEIPQPFEQFAPETRGLEFIVNCHARIGGVLVYYPLSVVVATL